MKAIKILSKMMTLIYLFYEFGNVNLKVTTILDDNGCWTGKVMLEQTEEPPQNDVELANFYTKEFCKKTIDN